MRSLKVCAPCLLLVVLGAAAAPAIASTIHVDVDGGGDYLTIQEGIGAATYGDTVLVHPGRYQEWLTMGGDKDGVLLVSLEGPDSTVIFAESGAGDPLLYIEGTGPTTTVSGFSFEGNWAVRGGAVRCASAGFTLEDCVIRNCRASEIGGGIYLDEPSGVVIRRCVISDCWSREGGGICHWGGDARIEDCELHDNWVTAFNGLDGGGVATYDVELLISGCLFEGNYSQPSHGAGVWADDFSDISVVNTVFHNQDGAAIKFYGSSLSVTSCVFTENGWAEYDGRVIGLWPSLSGGAVFTDNVFYANRDLVFDVRAGALPTISGNSIDPNGHLVFDVRESAEAGTLDATGNWWGTANPAEIPELIWDCVDSPEVDTCVDFANWCTDVSCGGQATSVEEISDPVPSSWGRIKSWYR